MTTAQQPIDEAKLEEFLGRVVGDLGAAINAELVRIGDALGLYRAMASAGPLAPAELAERTGTGERYVREWLNTQAAGGYVTYDAETQTYELPAEQAAALADENSTAYMLGAFQSLASLARDEGALTERFRSGDGFGWHEHDADLFDGTEKFFRPTYSAALVQEWVPALDGVEAKLRRGARIADVGCGHGASTAILARSYPNSTIVGFDYHAASIDTARRRAAAAGIEERAGFEVAGAKDYPVPEGGYDLICFFDCLHDMGDPVGAARHAREALADGGAVMLVEPFAGDRVEDNLNPVGRVYYGFSTLVCTPCSLAQEVGLGLGGQAGEARLEQVVREAGFRRFRRAAETPFNIVFEARP